MYALGGGIAGIRDPNCIAGGRAGVFCLRSFDRQCHGRAADEHLLGRFGFESRIGRRRGSNRNRPGLTGGQLEFDDFAIAGVDRADRMFRGQPRSSCRSDRVGRSRSRRRRCLDSRS